MLFAWSMLPVNLLLALLLFREWGFRRVETWGLCALMALNPYLILYGVSLMTEALFANWALAALLLAARGSRRGVAPGWAGLAGLASGMAYLTRSSGIVLLGLAVVLFWPRRQRRQAVWFCLGMLPAVVGWTWWVREHQLPTSDYNLLYYIDYVRFHLLSFAWHDLPVLLWRNLSSVVTALGGLHLLGISTEWHGMGFRLLLAGATIGGWVTLMRRVGMFPVGWFIIGHVGVLTLFHVLPGDPHERHLLPLLAPASAGLWIAARGTVQVALRWLRGSALTQAVAGAALMAGLGGLLCLGLLANIAVASQANRTLRVTVEVRDELHAAAHWIRDHVPADSRLLWIYRDVMGYLLSGRKGRSMFVPPRLHYYDDREGALRLSESVVESMRRYGLTYLVLRRPGDQRTSLDGVALRRLWEVAEQSPELRRAFRWGATSVYVLSSP
jgi:4-amino-4-deoxy-L-arabinose transferase-like glycosyltransferase